MIYLRELVKKGGPRGSGSYPMTAEILAGFQGLVFTRPVTILCGENGSGKTTLMALIAAGVKASLIGETGLRRDRARIFQGASRQFQFIMGQHPQRSFFFTAEDFSRYLDERARMAREAREGLEDIEQGYEGRSQAAKGLAAQPFARTLGEMAAQYERDLLQSSHGEGFLSFFGGRLIPRGLYLLDEPEGALSFANQLSLLALIDQAVAAQGQVIMATHSPVLAAYPKAALLEVERGGISEAAYDSLSSIQFLRHFLQHREGILLRAGIGEEAPL